MRQSWRRQTARSSAKCPLSHTRHPPGCFARIVQRTRDVTAKITENHRTEIQPYEAIRAGASPKTSNPESGSVVDQIPVARPISVFRNQTEKALTGHVNAIPKPRPAMNRPTKIYQKVGNPAVMTAPIRIVPRQTIPANSAGGRENRKRDCHDQMPMPKLVSAANPTSANDMPRNAVRAGKSGGIQRVLSGGSSRQKSRRITHRSVISDVRRRCPLFMHGNNNIYILVWCMSLNLREKRGKQGAGGPTRDCLIFVCL